MGTTTTCGDCNANQAWHQMKHTFGGLPSDNPPVIMPRFGGSFRPQPNQSMNNFTSPQVRSELNTKNPALSPINPTSIINGTPVQAAPPFSSVINKLPQPNPSNELNKPSKSSTSVINSNFNGWLPPLDSVQQSSSIPVSQSVTTSQILAKMAEGFKFMVQDPQGMDIQGSKIIVSGGHNDTPLMAMNGPAMPGFVHPHFPMRNISIYLEVGSVGGIDQSNLIIAEKTINDINYNGMWRGEIRHGSGTQTWPDGSIYEGGWKDGTACGLGRFRFANGDVYQGEFINDMANGKGILTRVDGAVSDGVWWNDELHGLGNQSWPDGSKYEGNFHKGHKHGEGRYVWADGSQYTGQWLNGVITGKGRAYWQDGRVYDGQWLNNKKHGKGVHTWPDGRRYEGDYEYDTRQGLGAFVLPDGSKYVGQWLKNKRHGKGSQTTTNGNIINSLWQSGKLTQTN